ncbi:unnamed protein product [Auanema sp. JU1783]|nr:unnamed protein product [Auanema sp. JU1783]
MYSGSQGAGESSQNSLNGNHIPENQSDAITDSFNLSNSYLHNSDNNAVMPTTSEEVHWLQALNEREQTRSGVPQEVLDVENQNNGAPASASFVTPLSPLSSPSIATTFKNDKSRLYFIKKHLSKLNLIFRRRFTSADKIKANNKVDKTDKVCNTLKDILDDPDDCSPSIPDHWIGLDVYEYLKAYENVIEEGNKKICTGELPNYLLQNNNFEPQPTPEFSQENRNYQHEVENTRPCLHPAIAMSTTAPSTSGLNNRNLRLRNNPTHVPGNGRSSWTKNLFSKPSNYYPEEDLPWANICYNEFQEKVGEIFKPKKREITIDGLCVVGCDSRFSIGSINNGNRRRGVTDIRSQIGKGIKLVYDGTNCMCYSLGKGPVFIQSPLFAISEEYDSMRVYRLAGLPENGIPMGMPIFDSRCFHHSYNKALSSGSLREIHSLQKACTVRISFIKGFGQNYVRSDISETPVWIEISFLKFLSIVDQAIVSSSSNDSVGSSSP